MLERIFPTPLAHPTDEQLLQWYSTGRDKDPWVSFNFVSSVDGAATVEGRSGALGNADDQHLFQLLRRTASVILVGAQTVRIEGYGGELLSPEAQQWRQSQGLAAHPPLAIVSGTLDLDPQLEVFTQAAVRPLIFTVESAPADKREALSQVADVVLAGSEKLDVDVLIQELAARGLTRIHSEGGPTLLGTFQSANRVDELCLSLSPLLVGGRAQRIADVLNGTEHLRHRSEPANEPTNMELVQILKADSMLFLRYLRQSS